MIVRQRLAIDRNASASAFTEIRALSNSTKTVTQGVPFRVPRARLCSLIGSPAVFNACSTENWSSGGTLLAFGFVVVNYSSPCWLGRSCSTAARSLFLIHCDSDISAACAARSNAVRSTDVVLISIRSDSTSSSGFGGLPLGRFMPSWYCRKTARQSARTPPDKRITVRTVNH